VAERPIDYPVAIVAGGSHGIGREIARMLASRGYAVVVAYLRDPGQAEAAVDEILAARGTALSVRADLTDELDVERLFDETKAIFGGVDVIVHTATRDGSVVDRRAADHLRRRGAIVDVSAALTGAEAGALIERARHETSSAEKP
jgi:3-oxoacyl-[acyl-carrier protein] reductase